MTVLDVWLAVSHATGQFSLLLAFCVPAAVVMTMLGWAIAVAIARGSRAMLDGWRVFRHNQRSTTKGKRQ